MFATIRRAPTLLAVLVFVLTSQAALAHHKSPTILDTLLRTDGAQAVVAAVQVVDQAGVLHFSLADLLDDRHAEVVLLAPSNDAFEQLLGLDRGTLDGLSVDDIAAALPGILGPLGLDADAVGKILLQHAALPKRANRRNASALALLEKGEIEVANGSTFPVGIGGVGIEINYETSVIKPDVFARNGVVHFIDTVIVDELL